MEFLEQMVNFVAPRVELAWRQAISPCCSFVWSAAKYMFWLVWVLSLFVLAHPVIAGLLILVIQPTLLVEGFKLFWRMRGKASQGVVTLFDAALANIPMEVEAQLPVVSQCDPPQVVERVVEKIIMRDQPRDLYFGYDLELLAMGVAIYALLATVLVMFLILKPKRVIRVCEHGFVVERAVEGSVPVRSPSPDFIGLVFSEENGIKTRQGVFFRVGDSLYTALHNFGSAVGSRKTYFVYGGKEILVEPEQVQQLDFDLVQVPYLPFSTFQMGAGKFVKYFTKTFCQIHNGDVQTFGSVEPAPVVGCINYTGTTLPGFSGAPYYMGKMIVGMHIGAGAVNMGFDGAHINLLSQYRVRRPESAEFTTDPQELYREMEEKGEEFEFRRMPNDYYEVRVRGHYVLYDEDQFDRVRAKYTSRNRTGSHVVTAESTHPQKIVLENVAPAAFTYQDQENCERPAANATAAAGSCLTDLAQGAVNQSVLDILTTLSNRLSAIESLPSAGHAQTPAQPSVASPSTSRLPSAQPRKRPTRGMLNSKLRELEAMVNALTQQLSAERNLSFPPPPAGFQMNG
nr:hypothetical protein [Solemoviridae sp.]